MLPPTGQLMNPLPRQHCVVVVVVLLTGCFKFVHAVLCLHEIRTAMEQEHSKWRKAKGRKSRNKKKTAETNRQKSLMRWSKTTEAATVDNTESEVRSVTPTGRPSTSARKMQYFTQGDGSQEELGEDRIESAVFLLVHRECLENILSSVVCKACKNGKPELLLSENHGFVKKITMKCSVCHDIVVQSYTSPRIPFTEETESTRPPFLCNRKIVDAFLDIGIGKNLEARLYLLFCMTVGLTIIICSGHTGLQRFSAAMNMSSMSIDAYMSHLHTLILENKRFVLPLCGLLVTAV